MGTITKFLRRTDAGMTVEFVALMPFFLFITFFAIEISIAVLSIGQVEKAVQAGARFALVSDPAVNTNTVCTAATSLRLFNCPRTSTYPPGGLCSANACENFVTVRCTGGAGGECNGTNFTIILNRMRQISPLIQAANVTIAYAYAGPAGGGLGYVGGPTVPTVTVTAGVLAGTNATAVAFGTVMTSLMTRIYNLVSRPGHVYTPNALTNLPTISVTLTGEDLTTAGAS